MFRAMTFLASLTILHLFILAESAMAQGASAFGYGAFGGGSTTNLLFITVLVFVVAGITAVLNQYQRFGQAVVSVLILAFFVSALGIFPDSSYIPISVDQFVSMLLLMLIGAAAIAGFRYSASARSRGGPQEPFRTSKLQDARTDQIQTEAISSLHAEDNASAAQSVTDAHNHIAKPTDAITKEIRRSPFDRGYD